MKWEDELYRMKIIQEAQDMFPNERNITVALKKYLSYIPKDKRIPLFITKKDAPVEMNLDKYIKRPTCPDCGFPMRFRLLHKNPDNFKVAILCSNPGCDTIFYTEKDIHELIQEFKNGLE
jgi:hypothetical protein